MRRLSHVQFWRALRSAQQSLDWTVCTGATPQQTKYLAQDLDVRLPSLFASGWLQTDLYRNYSKAAKHKKKGSTVAVTDAGSDAGWDVQDAKSAMEKAMNHLRHEYANLRTGRATPGMLDHLRVEVYGERMPLQGVATTSVRGPQLLAITVFDPEAVAAVEKAVRECPLHLNPRIEDQEVLVPIPRPTSESIAGMVKVAKGEAESAKVSVRHARKLAIDDIKKSFDSEDERKRAEKEVQKLTDDYITLIDSTLKQKEKEFSML